MAKITAIPTECPQCGGGVWDNTKKPKTSPKAPDARCKDKEGCGWAGWLPKDSAAPGGFGGGKGGSRTAYTWAELGNVYAKAKGIAGKVWGDKVTPAELIAATATVFIQAVQSGLKVDAQKPTDEEQSR